jgi:hypothetical protein
MNFKEIDIIKGGWLFCGIRYIASFHDYNNDHKEMLEKFSSGIPRKGDIIKVINQNTDLSDIFTVKYVFIDYVYNKMTIYCK